MKTRQPSTEEQDDLDSTSVPRWVLACWPRSWRESYGEEMSQTWADAGSARWSLVSLAAHGLHHRVVRPRAALSLDARGRPGYDVAITTHPRHLLRLVVMLGTAVVVAAITMALGSALGAIGPSSAGVSQAAVRAVELRTTLLLTFMVGLPFAVAACGERKTRHPQKRDVGIGLIVGSGLAVLLVLVAPAFATAAST